MLLESCRAFLVRGDWLKMVIYGIAVIIELMELMASQLTYFINFVVNFSKNQELCFVGFGGFFKNI